MRKLLQSQFGDTIVEVLLAVVVVGLAVTLGYGVASRSLKANRQAQERVEALKVVESQLERLKKRATTDSAATAGGVFQTNSFCLADSGGTNQVISQDAPADNIKDDPLTGYNNDCVDGLYHVNVKRDNTGNDTVQFTVTARWFGIGGVEKEETLVKYRVYPGSAT